MVDDLRINSLWFAPAGMSPWYGARSFLSCSISRAVAIRAALAANPRRRHLSLFGQRHDEEVPAGDHGQAKDETELERMPKLTEDQLLRVCVPRLLTNGCDVLPVSASPPSVVMMVLSGMAAVIVRSDPDQLTRVSRKTPTAFRRS